MGGLWPDFGPLEGPLRGAARLAGPDTAPV